MSKYDTQLSGLTPAEIIARLDGSGGLLALSDRELYFVDDNTQQIARLSSIKRIGVNKDTGKVEVSGESGTLMEIPPRAFQRDELKAFLESLKGHVLRAKSMPTQVGEPAPRTTLETQGAHPQPAADSLPGNLSSPTHSEEFEPHLAEQTPPTTQQAGTVASAPTPEEVPLAPEPPLNIVEPARTLPDEPSDSIWSYEGAPKTEPDRKAAVPPTPNPAVDNLTVPPPPYTGPVRPQASRASMVWLKVWALVTLLFTLGYLLTYFMNSGVTANVWTLMGVTVLGVALASIQWRLSEPL
ncbi:MAG: hypothetical protein C4332_11260 [Meiothermus sp.]